MHKFMIQVQALIDGHCKALFLQSNGSLTPYGELATYDSHYSNGSNYIIPISANPLHKGHLHMANFVPTVRDTIDGEPIDCEFELSIYNVDKHGLDAEEICDRLQQFMQLGRKCWITSFATFAQKAHFFQECQFVVGTDTANRIVNPAYYFDCVEERDKVMEDILNQNCSFMVLGRPGYVLDHYCFEHNHLFFIEDYTGLYMDTTYLQLKSEKMKK